MRRVALALLPLLLAASVAGAASETEPDPYAEVPSGIGGRINDGQVTYYMVHGRLQGSHLAVGPQTSGPRELDFAGCAYMQLRPWRLVLDEEGNVARDEEGPHAGVVRVVGLLDGETPMSLAVNTPKAPGHGPADLAENTTVVPFGLEPDHEPVVGAVEGWGEATLQVDGVVYPDPARVVEKDGRTFPQNRTQAHFFVTPQGFRDDATGNVTAPTSGGAEAHLHVESLDGARAPAVTRTMRPPSDVPVTPIAPRPRLLPTEAHSAHYPLFNSWFGGKAKLRFEAEADAPAGANEVRFDVHDPSGRLLANATLRPSLQGPDAAEAEVVLDQFGTYSVHAHGKVSMSMYTITAVLEPPKSFSLDLWWDQQDWGLDGRDRMGQCVAALATGSLVPPQVGRARPPQYDLPAVALGVGGVALGVGILVVLAVVRASASARKARS